LGYKYFYTLYFVEKLIFSDTGAQFGS